MELVSERRLIRGISVGMMILLGLVTMMGLNNQWPTLLSYLESAPFFERLGYTMMACLFPYFAIQRSRQERLIVLLSGTLLSIVIYFVHPNGTMNDYSSIKIIEGLCVGFGMASIVAVIFFGSRNEAEHQSRARLIDFYFFLAAIQFCVYPLLLLTGVFHPIAYDAIAFHMDSQFGFEPSIFMAKLAGTYSWFGSLLLFVYEGMLRLFPVLVALQFYQMQKRSPPVNFLLVWALSTTFAGLAYHFCPISGPVYFFGKDAFPNAIPLLSEIPNVATIVPPAYRNGFPSLHFGWCILMLMMTRHQKSIGLRVFFGIVTALTILATLATGEHYLIDLIGSFPFAVAIQSYCTHVNKQGQKFRFQAIATGVALWVTWVVFIKNGFWLAANVPGLVVAFSIFTVSASLYTYKRLWPYELWGYSEPVKAASENAEWSFNKVSIPVMFFISGFTGLVYEFVFSKQLALTFGRTANATYTVLAVYMGSMAIGAWLGGRLMARTKETGLVLYARCELVIGVYCITTPVLFVLARNIYVFLAEGYAPDAHWLVVLRVAFGAAVLLVPTILMGMTLPVMVSDLKSKGLGVGGAVSKLYGASTIGAATGALLSGYLFLPALGVSKSVALSAIGSLLVALLAFKLNKAIGQKNPPVYSVDTTIAMPKPTENVIPTVVIWAGLIALFLIGCVTLLLAVNYMQLLAVVAGNSAYAFSLMLFSLLLGLGVGANVARFIVSKGVPNALLFSLLLISLASVLLLGVFQWDQLPVMFGAYEAYPIPLGFGGRETIRAIACWSMMFPPAILIGACYPIALELVTERNQQAQQCRKLGTAIGLNTLGNIVGCVFGGFVLLPLLGTQRTILLAAAVCLFAGLMMALADRRLKNPFVVLLSLITVALFAVQPSSFNYTALASGANVYFQFRDYGEVVDHAESLDGGLTAVAVSHANEAGELKTLLTSGKFQGNNSLRGEMKAQLGFATTPLLHTVDRANALVIGYGTGVIARAIKESGFKQLDIVDLSRDLVDLSNKHFSDVNARVSEQAGVTTYYTDGRNYLLLQNKKYDLISIEITSIWFAGAASLYNQEFYELAAQRLTDQGVLQQCVQLHHVSQTDVASISSTVRSVFPNVRLYTVGGQGMIIATKNTQNFSQETAIDLMKAQPGLMSMFSQVGMSPDDIAGNLMLSPEDVTRLVKLYATSNDFVISTDDNLFLEYSTPKGNALDAQASLDHINGFLRRFSSSTHK